ncbi:MAG TPA: hypothetical protein VGD56_02260 [Gemmatirosa sp.]
MSRSPRPGAVAAPVLTRHQFHALTALGALAVGLTLANGTLVVVNRGTQDDIAARTAAVQQGAQLEVLQRDIARSLADLAVKGHDRPLLDMLAANGVTVTMNAPANAAAIGAAGSTSDSTRP